MTRVRREFEPQRRKGMWFIAVVTVFTMVLALGKDKHFVYADMASFSFWGMRVLNLEVQLSLQGESEVWRYGDLIALLREPPQFQDVALTEIAIEALTRLERAGLFFFTALIAAGVPALAALVLRTRLWVGGLLLFATAVAFTSTIVFIESARSYIRNVAYWPTDTSDLELGAPLHTRILLALWSLLAVAVVIGWTFDRIEQKPIPRRDTGTPAFD